MVDEKLAKLLAGDARRAILARLCADPSDAVWLRQLARDTGFGIGPVQRAVAALSRARLIRRRARGNRVYYSFNTAGPLYARLRRALGEKP
ncbi:hypothetical protein JXB37_01445 [candidate division WOR-3 bacterium]|nr:hypothetical protein [candidate division WOR-3 bacterium]